MIKLTEILKEAIKYPKEFEQFIKVGKESKNVNDFIAKVRQIKNVHPATASWFYRKYNPKEELSIEKTSELFLKDIKAGKYK